MAPPSLSPRPSALAGKGHVPLYTTVRASSLPWSRPSAHAGTGLPSPPATARVLAHPAPATGPGWSQRISPGPGAHTVRLPLGTGHGKGPCSARARIGFPKVVLVTPPRASTVYRSRQPGFGALPDPATSRLDARAAQAPGALDRACQSSKCPGEGPQQEQAQIGLRDLNVTSSSRLRQGPRGYSAQGTWCESHIMAPAVCM